MSFEWFTFYVAKFESCLDACMETTKCNSLKWQYKLLRFSTSLNYSTLLLAKFQTDNFSFLSLCFLYRSYLYVVQVFFYLCFLFYIFSVYPFYCIIFLFRVIKPHSSICLHIFCHFRWTSECHPKCRDVQVMGIVTYAWWFQEPDHTRMLCLRWSTSISYAAPCNMLHQCVTCLDISTLPRDWYSPLINFHPGWQRSCLMPSSAGVAIHGSGWLLQIRQ